MNEGVEILLLFLEREKLELFLELFCELPSSDDVGLIIDPPPCSELRHHKNDEATQKPEEEEVGEGERYFSEVNTNLEIGEKEQHTRY